MNVSLRESLFLTPGTQRFLSEIGDDLAQRRSLLLLLPSGMNPTELWEALREELRRRDFYPHEILLPHLPTNCSPAAALGHGLEVQWDPPHIPRTAANLMTKHSLPELMYLEGLDQLPSGAQAEWMDFLVQWMQASHTIVNSGKKPATLCLLSPAATILSKVPQSDVYLSVRWWWGLPSALEVHLMCRFGCDYTERDAIIRWREHMVPSLVGNDLSLAEYLWEKLDLDFDDLVEHLRDFAQQREWTEAALKAWGAEEFITNQIGNHAQHTLTPPLRYSTLWAQGALCWTPEFGLELHTAALAALGQRDSIRHRIWRGQAAFLLPFIDSVRLAICEHLTRRFGRDWPFCWRVPTSPQEDAEVRDNPLACQLGHLKWLLQDSPLRSEHQWRVLVAQAHEMRNRLAHGRPVYLSAFESICGEIRRLKDKGVSLPVSV